MSASTSDRNVLLTGASAGIGRASARQFVRDGWNVWAVARSGERLRALASELDGPPRCVPLEADLTDAPGMEVLAERVLRDLGIPGVVVANAGVGLDARFLDTTDADLASVFEVNVLGVVRSVRPFLPGMIDRGSGRIVLISSVVGKRGVPHYSAYSASKFALHGMADAMRAELWGSGVTVGVVCPSSTVTEFHDRMKTSGPRQKWVRVSRHSAESVARAIVRMSRSRRREVVLSAEGKLVTFVNTLAPGLVDRLLAKMLVQGNRRS